MTSWLRVPQILEKNVSNEKRRNDNADRALAAIDARVTAIDARVTSIESLVREDLVTQVADIGKDLAQALQARARRPVTPSPR